MKIKSILDEAIVKGEKIKSEVLNELFKSKTMHELVTNKNFIKAVTRIIETKEEVQKAINHQVSNIFEIMDVPTKGELKKVATKLINLEKLVERVGRRKIAVKVLNKTKPKAKNKPSVKAKTSKTKATKKNLRASPVKKKNTLKTKTGSKKKTKKR